MGPWEFSPLEKGSLFKVLRGEWEYFPQVSLSCQRMAFSVSDILGFDECVKGGNRRISGLCLRAEFLF